MLSQIASSSASAGTTEFLHLLEQCTSILQQEQKGTTTTNTTHNTVAGATITEGLVEVDHYDNLAIISDLHGDSVTLFRILDLIGYEKFLSSPNNRMVFLGDYVDRGRDSTGVLYAICRLKATSPNSVILMRGNHEAPSEFPFSSHDLPYNIQDRFGSSFAKAIYGKILALFKLMTLATVIKDRLFLVHGGLPTGVVTSDDYKSSSTILGGWKQAIATARQNHLQNSIMAELLWNDPRTLEGLEPWEPSSRGIGRHFGSKITERWLRATNTRVVVRGHEPCQGYRIDHQGKIMTLFSCTQAYSNISSAGYILASKKDIDLVNNAYDLSKFVRKIPRE